MVVSKRIMKRIAEVLSYLIFLLTLLAAYGGYVNPDHFTIPAIAVLFFPYLAIGTLIIAIVWLVTRNYIPGCIGIAALLASGPTFPEALPFKFPNVIQDEKNTFRLITFNCLHLRDIKNPDSPTSRSISFLIDADADFVCLQEMYYLGPPELPESYQPQIDSLKQKYPYYSTDGGNEVEFLSKYPFEPIPLKLPIQLKYGACAAYRVNIDGRILNIVNVHLSSYKLNGKEKNVITQITGKTGAEDSFKEIQGSIYTKLKNAYRERAEMATCIAQEASMLEGDVIICGDFNDVPGSWSYRRFTEMGFNDAYAQTSFGHMITYNSYLMLFHIDQILYRGDMVPVKVFKHKHNASDHYPVEAIFEFI